MVKIQVRCTSLYFTHISRLDSRSCCLPNTEDPRRSLGMMLSVLHCDPHPTSSGRERRLCALRFHSARVRRRGSGSDTCLKKHVQISKFPMAARCTSWQQNGVYVGLELGNKHCVYVGLSPTYTQCSLQFVTLLTLAARRTGAGLPPSITSIMFTQRFISHRQCLLSTDTG
jgi:hypothetical protein